MKYKISLLVWLVLMMLLPLSASALPDQFEGDSAIYSGNTQYLRPNVLFIIDNSASMRQAGSRDPYDPAVDYTYGGAAYVKDKVYERKTATGGVINYVDYGLVLSGVVCTTANDALDDNGFFAGKLKRNDGSCTAAQSGNFFLGNLLNYINAPSATAVWQANIAYPVGAKVRPTTPVLDINGVPLEFEILVAGVSGASEPVWPTTVGSTISDNTVTWGIAGSIIDMVKVTLKQVIAGARESVNFGVMTFGDNNSGGKILKPVRKMASTDTNGDTYYSEAAAAITGITLLGANSQPVNETLWDAGLYFEGRNNASSKISSDNTPYPTPLEFSCQKNFVIVLTTGATDNDAQTKLKVGDKNSDGNFGFIDDSAKYLYENLNGLRVQTNVVQLLTPEVSRLKQATNAAHGRGSYFHINDANELTQALLDAMSNIVNESDTSFVAPVVPTSPENRTYSGERVYLGFFKPISQRPWHGNLKKYGIDRYSRITDKNGDLATNTDGSFSAAAVSFWSTWNDAGKVEEGGVGGALLTRNFATDPRKLYTYLGNADLTNAANSFTAANISAAQLGVVDDTAKGKLINYVYGYDAYDDDGNAVTAEKRDWILGDILHSKPLIVNYNSFAFSTANESACGTNKTMIYVGTNDGMLHAFRDCDGGEEWAFIPPNLLPNLKELAVRPAKHTYFVDSSPVSYTYDANHDGTIDTSNDKVLLIFGQRRGGDAYYALDVTNPAAPRFFWKIDPTTTGFSQLGETWSEPQIAKIKVDNVFKEALFFGAGYDSFEDGRYGTATLVPSSVPTPNKGEGNVTNAQAQWIDLIPAASGGWKGKGIYIAELATLSGGLDGSPDFTSSGSLLWSFIRNDGNSPLNSYDMWYAVPSEITVLDKNYDHLADRLYIGDSAGRMWRFDVGDNARSNWKGKIIFTDGTYSQKIFFRPSVTLQSDYVAVFFGSGDREHPLNTAVVNRFYMLKDYNDPIAGVTNPNIPNPAPAHKMVTLTLLKDVTLNELQLSTTTQATKDAIMNELNSVNNFGWYIRLNERLGEKILAPPLAYNKVALFTTYTPNAGSGDVCAPGNLGVSRLYAVNYLTGEAALNFNGGNDSESTAGNTRALSEDGKVLRRSDRSVTLGVGIPSGIVVIMPPSGDAELLIGSGGGLARKDPPLGGTIIPIYWMQW